MTNADESSPQYCPPVPDTAMATGSEDGEPGEQLDERSLRPDERAVLTDDSVLPVDAGSRGDEDDPLTPEFRAPPPG